MYLSVICLASGVAHGGLEGLLLHSCAHSRCCDQQRVPSDPHQKHRSPWLGEATTSMAGRFKHCPTCWPWGITSCPPVSLLLP